MNFTNLAKRTLMHMALLSGTLAASGTTSAYYGRRGNDSGHRNQTYLIDESLGGISRNLLKYKQTLGISDAVPPIDAIILNKISAVRELVIVDQNLKGFRKFSSLARPGVEVVEISADSDGADKLIEILSRYQGLNAVHLFSHATAGQLQLGNSLIGTDELRTNPELLKVINRAIKAGGDLLLYGCELGSGNKGEEFLEIIKGNTHVDVAASIDLTGNADYNGNWELEIQKGDIHATPIKGSVALKDFTGVLQFSGTINFNYYKSGSGAYNGALNDAQFYESASKNYLLTVNGADRGTYRWSGYQYVVNAYGYETSITLEFTNGETFTPSSISLYNFSGGNRTFYLTTDKGGSVNTGSLPNFGRSNNLNISGLPDDVKSLTITANGSFYLAIDDFILSNLLSVPSDITPPAVTGINLSGTPVANASSVSFDVTFDESSNNISTDDFQVTTVSGSATGTVSNVSASSGSSVTVTVNSISGTGSIRLDLKSNTNITDASGNGNNSNGYVAAYTSGSTHTVDRDSPTVSSVSVPANATYVAGQNLDFTINSSENIIVNTGGGTPQLSLTIGSTTRQATYLSGSGTSALVFRYKVQSGDLDADGIAAGTLSSNGGTLRDAAGNNMNTTLNGVGSTASVLVDAVAPTVSSVSVPANATYVAGQNLDFTINSSENIIVNTVGGIPQLSLTIGSTTRQATYLSGTGTSALVFRYTAQSGDLDVDGIAVGALLANGGTLKDGAGNDLNNTLNSVGSTASVLIDAVAPVISSVSISNIAVKVDDAITVTITAGETGLSLASGTVNGVSVTGFTDNSDNTYSATYTVVEGHTDRAAGDDVPVNFVLTDAAGNNSNPYTAAISQSSDAIDANSPVASNLSPLDDAMDVSLNANLEITFSENISPGTGNITIYRTSDDGIEQTIAITDALQVSVSGNVVTINPTSDLPASVSLYVQIDNTAFEDNAGNSYAGIGDKTTWNFTTADQIDMSINDPSVSEGAGGTTNLTFTVTLTQPVPVGGASVSYSTSDGTAMAGSDYTSASGTLSFAAGETSKTIEVTVSGDAMLEADETLIMTLSAVTGANVVLTDGSGTGTILNDDAAALTIADVSGNEDDGAITVTVTLDNAVQGGFTIDVNTSDGTALAGTDYTAISSQTLSFVGTPGESQTFTVTPTADTDTESDETINVSLSNLAATALSVDITDGAMLTIVNDDILTAIRNGAKENHFSIYPNPFTDFFSITSDIVNPMEVTLFDVNGNKIVSQEIGSNTGKIVNLDGLTPGVYILEIKQNGKVSYSRIIKQE